MLRMANEGISLLVACLLLIFQIKNSGILTDLPRLATLLCLQGLKLNHTHNDFFILATLEDWAGRNIGENDHKSCLSANYRPSPAHLNQENRFMPLTNPAYFNPYEANEEMHKNILW